MPITCQSHVNHMSITRQSQANQGPRNLGKYNPWGARTTFQYVLDCRNPDSTALESLTGIHFPRPYAIFECQSFGKALEKLGKSFGKALEKLCKSFAKALEKLWKSFEKALQKLCKSFAKALQKLSSRGHLGTPYPALRGPVCVTRSPKKLKIPPPRFVHWAHLSNKFANFCSRLPLMKKPGAVF